MFYIQKGTCDISQQKGRMGDTRTMAGAERRMGGGREQQTEKSPSKPYTKLREIDCLLVSNSDNEC